MKHLVLLFVLLLAATAAANDDILGRTDGGDRPLFKSGSPGSRVPVRSPSVALSDSVGPAMMLDSALGLISAEGVQSYVELACGEEAYLVAWHDGRRNMKNDIMATRVNFQGQVLDTQNIIVSGKLTEESYPAVAFDGTNWLVVWSDLRSGIADIWGARVNQDGVVIDSAGFLISAGTNTQTIPCVEFNGTDYLVAWTDYRASTWKTYCARVTPAGTVLDPQGILLSGGGCLYPEITSNGSDWLVTWHDEPAALIMAGRVGPDGTVRDGTGFVVGSGANDRFFPDAAFDGTNYYIVWQDRRQGTNVNQWSVYGARVTTAGVVLDPTGRVVVGNDGKYEGIPQVGWGDSLYLVTYKDDGFSMRGAARVRLDGTVVDPNAFPLGGMPQWFADVGFDGTRWLAISSGNRESGGAGGGEDPMATRVTTSGQVLDPFPNIQLAYSARWQHYPAAAWDGSHWLAVWQEQVAVSNSNLRGVLLDATGVPAGEPFDICAEAGHATTADVVAADSGWLVLWQDYRTGQMEDLYAARVAPDGTVLDPNGFAVASVPNVNRYPAAAFDGTNWMVAFWKFVAPEYHIYAARISQSGTVLDPDGFDVAAAVYGTGWNWHVKLGMAFDGTNYLAAWPDYRNGSYDVYGVRITPAGQILDPGGFTIARSFGDQELLQLDYGRGRYCVVWQDTRAGKEVYATLVDTFGVSVDTAGFLVSREAGGGLEPAVSFDGVTFVAVWTDSNSSGRDVYLARIDPELGLKDSTPIAVAATAEIEGGPAIAGGPPGTAAALFQRYAPAPWMCTRTWAALYSEQTGVAEPKRLTAYGSRLSASHVRGVLNLTSAISSLTSDIALLDAAGRRVLTLRAGANDVSSLAPGIYFVRSKTGSRQSSVARIVIAK
jgi:hypothetical protein